MPVWAAVSHVGWRNERDANNTWRG